MSKARDLSKLDITDAVSVTVNNTATVAQMSTDANNALLVENTNAAGVSGLRMRGGSGKAAIMYGENNSTDEFSIIPRNDTSKAFTIDSVGNVVVAGNLQIEGSQTVLNTATLSVEDLNITVASGATTDSEANGAGLTVAGAAATLLYTATGDKWAFNKPLDVTGSVTSSGTLTANAGVVVDNFTLDGTTLALSSGDMTLDVAGDITLDADGGSIHLHNGGTDYGQINLSSNNINIYSEISDGDIQFFGNDGGTTITALTLDMSAAGNATFSGNVTTGASLISTNAIVDNLMVKTSSGSMLVKTNAGANIARFNNILTTDLFGSLDVTGNITVSGTVDGVDIQTLNTTAGAALPKAGGTMTGSLTVQTLVGINKAVNSAVGLSVGSDASSATSYGLEICNSSSNTRFLVDGLGSQRFYGSDNAETARFTDGKLGIGTDNPGALLDVNDSGVTDNAWNTLAKFRPDLSDSSAETSIHIQSYPSTTVVGDRRAGIQSIDDAGAARPLLLNKAGGNVGIGNAAPAYSLDFAVGNTIRLHHTAAGSAIRVGASDYDVNLIRFDGATGITDNGYYGGALRYMGSRSSNNNSLSIFMDNSTGTEVEAMTILQDGKVGIGTDSPVTALEISTDGADHLTLNRADASININNVLGGIVVSADDPTANRSGAKIGFTAGANWTTNNFPTNIIFSNDASGTMTDRMRINSDGHLLVGVTNGSADVGGTTTGIRLGANGQLMASGSGTGTYNYPAYFDRRGTDNTGDSVALGLQGYLKSSIGVIGTSGGTDDGGITFNTWANNVTRTERLRIDASGFVGINTAGAVSYTPLTLETASGSAFSAGGVNGVGLMLRNRSSTVGTSSGIKWAANTSYHDLGGIHMVLTGNSSTNETADLTFFTSNSGDSGNTEKMRITSAGNVIQGNNGSHSWTAINNTLFSAGGIGVTSNSDWGLQMAGSTTERIRFFTSAGGSGTVGNISVNTAGTTYSTTSDVRLKKNIKTITDGTDKLMSMNPVTHGWKADPEAATVHGFIAQEMMNIVPEAVSGDPEGEEMMSMDYGRITPVIVAALQDALKEIKELKIRINELEDAS